MKGDYLVAPLGIAILEQIVFRVNTFFEKFFRGKLISGNVHTIPQIPEISPRNEKRGSVGQKVSARYTLNEGKYAGAYIFD